MSASAIPAQAQVNHAVGLTSQPTTYAAPAQQYSFPQQVTTGYSHPGQQSIYMQQAPVTTYAAPAATTYLSHPQATAAPAVTYSAPSQPIAYTGATTAATQVVQSSYAATGSTIGQPVSTSIQAAEPAPVTQVQESTPLVTYQAAAHPQAQYSAPAVTQYSAPVHQQSTLVHPAYAAAPLATTQFSAAQPAATYVHDVAQAAPAAESPQPATYQAGSAQPFTYAAVPSYGAATVQTHSPAMYQHQQQYQSPYVMSPHTGFPTAHSMVAYPVGAGIPQHAAIQPEAAVQAHSAAPPADSAEATASTAQAKEQAPVKKTSKKSKKSSKKTKRGCC